MVTTPLRELLSKVEGILEYAAFKDGALIDSRADANTLGLFKEFVSKLKPEDEFFVDKNSRILIYNAKPLVLAFKYEAPEGWVIYQLRRMVRGEGAKVLAGFLEERAESISARRGSAEIRAEVQTLIAEGVLEKAKEKVVVYEDPSGYKVEVKVPLEDRADVDRYRLELGLPEYLNLNEPPLRKAVASLWLAFKAPELDKLFPEALLKQFKERLKVLAGGDVAFKILSPSLNDSNSPFYQPVEEVFFVAHRRHMKQFLNLLLLQGRLLGDFHIYFLTEEDRTFNKMLRILSPLHVLRVSTLKTEGAGVEVEAVEIHGEHVLYQHLAKCREATLNPGDYLYALPREIALLSKLMKIREVDEKTLRSMSEKDRLSILGVAPYDYNKIIVGMSFRDMIYCYALIKDSYISLGKDCINFGNYGAILRKDPKFATTVRANMENLLNRVEVLYELGVDEMTIDAIKSKIKRLLDFTPRVSKKWSGPWWSKT